VTIVSAFDPVVCVGLIFFRQASSGVPGSYPMRESLCHTTRHKIFNTVKWVGAWQQG
jgi:hypothetical protein